MQNLYSQRNIILRLTIRASQRLFLEEGNRAPWGLYMHAAWFFGQPWHFEGYKMFIQVTKIFLMTSEGEILLLQEISSYDDVWIVPVKAGLDYMENPLSNEQLIAAGFPSLTLASSSSLSCSS